MNITDLTTVRVLQLKVEETTERIARIRSSMTSLTTQYTNCPGSNKAKQDRIGSQLAALERLELRLSREIVEYEEKLKGVEVELSLFTPEQNVLLRMKYFEGRKLKEIAGHLNFSYRQCKRIHSRALKKMSPNVP